MISIKKEIIHEINCIRKEVLLIGQSSLSKDQFKAFRRLILDLIGEKEREIYRILDRTGNNWNDSKKGCVSWMENIKKYFKEKYNIEFSDDEALKSKTNLTAYFNILMNWYEKKK